MTSVVAAGPPVETTVSGLGIQKIDWVGFSDVGWAVYVPGATLSVLPAGTAAMAVSRSV